MMSPRSRIDARKRIAWRLFCAILIIAHFRATWRLAGDAFASDGADGAWGRLLLLSASNLFFVLEIVFLPCLRALRHRRNVVAMILVVALLHAGVLPGIVAQLDHREAAPIVAILSLSGAALCHVILRRVRRHLVARAGGIPAARMGRRALRDRFAVTCLRPRLSPLSTWMGAGLRAPPAGLAV